MSVGSHHSTVTPLLRHRQLVSLPSTSKVWRSPHRKPAKAAHRIRFMVLPSYAASLGPIGYFQGQRSDVFKPFPREMKEEVGMSHQGNAIRLRGLRRATVQKRRLKSLTNAYDLAIRPVPGIIPKRHSPFCPPTYPPTCTVSNIKVRRLARRSLTASSRSAKPNSLNRAREASIGANPSSIGSPT